MIWLNALHFQAVWWAMVLWGDGLSAVLALASLGLFLVVARVPLQRLVLMGTLVAVGYALDGVLAAFGVIAFRGQSGILPPLWLALVWFNFVLSLGFSLRWLAQLPWLAGAAVGAVAGPLAYIGAAAVGAASFSSPAFGLVVMAAAWSVLLPVMVWMMGDQNETIQDGRRAGV